MLRQLCAVALVIIVGVSCGEDAGDGPPPKIPCGELEAEWLKFVKRNRACTSVDDCTVAGGAEPCYCGAYSGSPSGNAIAKSAREDAFEYLARFHECREQAGNSMLFRTCDAAPAKNLRCEDEQCLADNASCLD